MKSVKGIKKIQVDKKKHFVPVEDAEIEKLLQRGLSLKKKANDIKKELETVQARMIEIAQTRRENTTTVVLEGISAQALITFRESYVVNDDIERIRIPLGPLFDRFFDKKTDYKTTADFKKFMESDHALGLENPAEVKKNIMKYVAIKSTKPNVKMEAKG